MSANEAKQFEQHARSIVETLDKTLVMIRQIAYIQERINWMQAANARDDEEARKSWWTKAGEWIRRTVRVS